MRLTSVLRVAAAMACACVLPGLAFAGACTTQSVGSLLGTSCSVGDVEYNFFASGDFEGISASSLTFTPGGTALDPSFSITGPLNVTSTPPVGIGQAPQGFMDFVFFWTATVIPSGLEIGSATNTINGAMLPSSPNTWFVNAGNNTGIPSSTNPFGFTNATLQTGGPNTNPSSTMEDTTNIPIDGLFFTMIVQDNTGNGATLSITSTSYQYDLVPTPEPSSLLLLGTGLLGLCFASKKLLTNNA